MKKTVLILGGTRFIGRYILELLNNDIFDVYYFHRGKTCFEPKVSSVEILGNRTNEDDVQQLFKHNSSMFKIYYTVTYFLKPIQPVLRYHDCFSLLFPE